MLSCPLCFSSAEKLAFRKGESRYWHCLECDLRFLDPVFFLSAEEEKKRYLFHQNDALDTNYQNFVRPLFEAVKAWREPGMEGLDFGAGRDSALSRLFEEGGFRMEKYDPYFFPNPSSLERSYDFVCASEVAEHFYRPGAEWPRLRKFLKPTGVLGVMTSFYAPEVDFESWYYRKDPTHVCFYSSQTLEWLAARLGFSRFQVFGNRTVCFQT